MARNAVRVAFTDRPGRVRGLRRSPACVAGQIALAKTRSEPRNLTSPWACIAGWGCRTLQLSSKRFGEDRRNRQRFRRRVSDLAPSGGVPKPKGGRRSPDSDQNFGLVRGSGIGAVAKQLRRGNPERAEAPAKAQSGFLRFSTPASPTNCQRRCRLPLEVICRV